jgi:hypothetical protein
VAETIHVRGLREFVLAADAAGKETKKLVRDRLREVAEPVLADARSKLSRYDARSASRLGVSVRRAGTVTVEQRLRRTTGAHPQFGADPRVGRERRHDRASVRGRPGRHRRQARERVIAWVSR